MKWMSKLIVSCAVLMIGAQAQADLLLEPYLGYHAGTTKVSGTTSSSKDSGPSYGARVGYQTLGLMLGIDYMTGMWKDDESPKNDLTPTQTGLFVGYNFPVMLRVYGVIVPEALKASMKVKAATSSDKYDGSAMKVGVGFTALPMVSINLELIKVTYTKDGSNGNSLPNNINSDMYGLTISLPLTF